ncbi:hypothetical protein C8Q76DRAFT_23452 [Earliella scabrosa]|nr:hypothetical protein C8Q76DRAFT_23452 [Earliella scabrosa]
MGRRQRGLTTTQHHPRANEGPAQISALWRSAMRTRCTMYVPGAAAFRRRDLGRTRCMCSLLDVGCPSRDGARRRWCSVVQLVRLCPHLALADRASHDRRGELPANVNEQHRDKRICSRPASPEAQVAPFAASGVGRCSSQCLRKIVGRRVLLSKCERLYASLTRRHYRGGRQLSRASCSQGECTARELAAVGPASSSAAVVMSSRSRRGSMLPSMFEVATRVRTTGRAGAEDVVRVYVARPTRRSEWKPIFTAPRRRHIHLRCTQKPSLRPSLPSFPSPPSL